MKTLFNLCLSLALSIGLFNYGFSQAAASSSKDVTPPPSTEDVATQQQNVEGDEEIKSESVSNYGFKIPRSIEEKIFARDFDGAWKEFENLIKGSGKEQRAQILEATAMLGNWFASLDNNRANWIKIRNEAQQALLKEFPKWAETYNSQINYDATPKQIIEYTTKGLQYDSKNYLMYERRGRAYLQLGQTKEACADFDKCPDKSRIWEYESACKKQE